MESDEEKQDERDTHLVDPPEEEPSQAEIPDVLPTVPLQPNIFSGRVLGPTAWATIVSKVLGLSCTASSPIIVRTACSGTNAPMLALKEIAASLGT